MGFRVSVALELSLVDAAVAPLDFAPFLTLSFSCSSSIL